MDAELKRIIKKIQKLYRLRCQCREARRKRKNAAMHAREMLEKYDLTLSDIEGFTEEDCGAEEHFIIKKKYLPAHINLLANAMAMLFQCQVLVLAQLRLQQKSAGRGFIGVGADSQVVTKPDAGIPAPVCREKGPGSAALSGITKTITFSVLPMPC